MRTPLVSVLMPTFKQATFILRGLESLRAQTLTDWELVLVDDGSPDETAAIVAPFLADERIRYTRLERNTGLGAALNVATGLARGRYLAYLPSDDLYYPEHLADLVALLERRPEVYVAHAGLRHGYHHFGPSVEWQDWPSEQDTDRAFASTSPAALRMVQVLHRRGHETSLRWPERAERESDTLEGEHWAALVELGELAFSGAISCEWVDHSDQRSKIIAPSGGLSRYRSHYGLGREQWVNFQPARGWRLEERARYGHLARERELPAPGGLRILLVGELGFNPERVLAFEEQGHKLLALWVPRPESWDTAGPLPYGNLDVIPYEPGWQELVRAARPNVIYALLNWQAISLIDEVRAARLGVPLVFHFKEGPFICVERGLWPALMRILRASAANVWLNAETREWFRPALDAAIVDGKPSLLLDGDLPKADWFTDTWAPKLSAQDGQIHTVCPGRPLGLEPFEPIAAAGIHVHLYGEQFHQVAPNLIRAGLATGHLHLHPAVGPEQWVSELSRYDAAWLHLFSSRNGGDLRRALWDDLNLPARLGTYAAAGLPWIMRDNTGHTVALQRLAYDLGVGLPFSSYAELGEQLRDRAHLGQITTNMRAARHSFAFDSHVTALVKLFREVI